MLGDRHSAPGKSGLIVGRRYSDAEMATRQLVFLDVWVAPFFKAAAILFPGARGRLRQVETNREACKEEGVH